MTQPLLLEVGNLTAQFDTDTGLLRRIHFRGVEVLRGIYAAVRNRNWDTIAPTITNLLLKSDSSGFQLTFTADCQQQEIDFTWEGAIRGDASGRIRYDFQGRSRSEFLRNRIGFCVLHAPQCGGLPCEVVQVDGSRSQSHFPDAISPHQPLMNLRSLRHEPAANLAVEVLMEGETFEMEDQRNWTDASFKTYCTPLGEPFPVKTAAGETIRQSVSLTIEEQETDEQDLDADSSKSDATLLSSGAGLAKSTDVVSISFDRDAVRSPLPAIGLGCATGMEPLSLRQTELLKQLSPAHLRVDADFSHSNAIETLQRAVQQAEALDAKVEAALFLTDRAEEQLQQVAAIAADEAWPIARWLIFHVEEKTTSERWVRLARQVFFRHEQLSERPIYGGTNAYFTELNRDRPATAAIDGVCYSINPQVHAFDNDSLMETAAMQMETVRSARSFLPGLPIAVSPVTLRPRFNPNATGPEPQPAPGELSSQVDPRQASRFAAAWSLASLKYLSESGVESITYYETVGQRGVMEVESDNFVPSKFPSRPGEAYPLFHVLADIAERRDAQVIASNSSDALRTIAFYLTREAQHRILVGNLCDGPTSVQVAAPRGQWTARRLNESTLIHVRQRPLEFREASHEHFRASESGLRIELEPYEVVTLDLQ